MLKPKDIFKAVLYIDSSLAGFIQLEIEDSPRLKIKNSEPKVAICVEKISTKLKHSIKK